MNNNKNEELMAEDLSYRLDFLSEKKSKKIRYISDNSDIKCSNHFEFNWNLGNKKALYFNMR